MGLLQIGGLLAAAAIFPTSQAVPTAQVNDTCADPGSGSSNSLVQSSNTTWPWQTYESSSLTPPNLTITSNGASLGPGYAFICPKSLVAGSTKQATAFIMTEQNELVYGSNDTSLSNIRVQNFKGKDYITYWSAAAQGTAGQAYGSFAMLDTEYKQAYNICVDLGLNSRTQPTPACQIDSHEQLITPRNTLLVAGYNYTSADLTSVNGPADGWITDTLIFEIDMETQAVLFSWSAAAHIPFTASKMPLSANGNGTAAAPWDPYHINSAQMVGDNFLVNVRHTWTTYMVDGTNGHIMWALNGQTGGDFGALPAGGNFSWQHYVRAHNVSDSSISISYFANDNAAMLTTNATKQPTKGLMLELALPPNKAQTPKIVRHLERAEEEIYVGSQGSYQIDVSPSGNQFMGYGQIAVMREYGPSTDGSDLRWEARFGADNAVSSYRSYKQVWHGTPASWDPTLVVKSGNASTSSSASGFVSWNGATEVQRWNVYNGASASSMKMAGSVAYAGFETKFNAPATGCVQVEAVMRNATRKSNVVCN